MLECFLTEKKKKTKKGGRNQMMRRASQFIKLQFPFSFISSIRHTCSFFIESSSLFIFNQLLLMSSSCLSTAPDIFDKLPPRRGPSLDNTLNLIRVSIGRSPHIAIHHCLALKVGALAHVPTSTSLLTMYSRAGDLASSWILFNQIISKDVISWNAMITACVENQCFPAAVKTFREMMKKGCEFFDSTTLLIIISALTRMNAMKQGQLLQGLSFKLGMDSDVFLSNALIDMYAKCCDLSSSERMFAGMKFRDTTSWNSMICGCIYNGHHEKSLCYFRNIASSGKLVDYVSFSCAISACSYLGEFGAGQVIHGWSIKLGYGDTSHISVPNTLISFYSHCGDIEAAEAVFRGMLLTKDVVSWNSMLDGFAENGKILEAFNLLHEMQLMGAVEPDTVTVATVISLCAELKLVEQGRTIHGFAIRKEMGLDLLVTNSLMDMYSKCNSLKSAEILFKAIPERDVVSWNTMIAGYSQNECTKEAQNLFRELHCSGPQCSLLTLLAILPSCDSPEDHHFGKLIHCWQLKLGFLTNVLAVNALMFMYIKCGYLEASFSLLRSISVMADVASWNTFIVGCVQHGHFQKSLEAFNLMQQEPLISSDSITLFSVLSACGNLKLVFQGRFLHGLTIKTFMGSDIRVTNALITMYSKCRDIESASTIFGSSPYHNLCSWNCMISGFSQNSKGGKALELFSCLEFEPTEITIVSILSACAQLGALRHGRQIHGHVVRFEIHRNSYISSSLVDMYSKCGRLDISILIFQNSLEKSIASWNSMIAAYGFHSNGRKAIELFHDMCQSGTRATNGTFVSLLSACSHSGLVDEGCWYYNHMLDKFEVEPATEHHVCMVDMLGRAGRLQEAYEFIKQMSTLPAPGVWGALLSACNYHGDLEMGKQIAENLFEVEPENVGYYVSLSNMYIAAGRWNDAMGVRGMVQDKGLRKPSGYSLIDV